MLTRDWTGCCGCAGGISAVIGADGTAAVTSVSRGIDGSLGMDFLRHGVGSSPVGIGANAGATTVDVFLPVEEEEEEFDCCCSWNVEVERIEWPVVSPDKTKGAGAATTRLDGADGLPVVGRVTLDV